MSMNNYPLKANKVNWRILHPLNVLSTEEHIAEHNDLYLSTEFSNDESGYPHKRFRLHAKYPHNIEQALAYDIKCPSCGNYLKQVGRCRDSHTLGLYKCPVCDRD